MIGPQGHESLHQQQEQHAAERPTRPDRSIEHSMVRLKLSLLAEAHNPEHRGHGAPARRQDRTQQQEAGVWLNAVGKVRRKSFDQVMIGLGRESYD
jgi:hypothetical protein